MNKQKEKLYRKDNKKALHYEGNTGWEYRYDRNTKKLKEFEGNFKGIKKTDKGMDYTPLYRFLQSKVGSNWDEVHSEAISRLDKEEPIWHIVILDTEEPSRYNLKSGITRVGNSQYHSLTVNEDRILVKINSDALPYPPSCSCCTHTFNGKVIPYIEEPRRSQIIEERHPQRW